MNIIKLITLILSFNILFCLEETGIKFEVNEEVARAVLYHFYPDINNEIKDMKLEDIRIKKGINIRDIRVQVLNFTPDKVKFSFTESGISINISGISVNVFGNLKVSRYVIPKTFKIAKNIELVNFDANLKVTYRTINNSLYPNAEFIGAPKVDIDFYLHFSLPFGLGDALERLVKDKIRDAINSFLERKSNSFLEDAINLIPMNITIDEYNGYAIDYSLVNPIRMKNGYLEVNSYALLYNERIKETQIKKKQDIPLSSVPDMIKINNQYQLYISQYSINSALYTFFKTEPLSLTLDSNIVTGLLSVVLPGIYQKYGNEKVIVIFKTRKEGQLELNENGAIGKIFGQMIVKIKGTNELIFQCDLDLLTEVEIIVKNLISITGNIHSLNINVGKVYENKCSSQILIEKSINLITSFVIPLANGIIEKSIKFDLPVFFKEIIINHNKQYISISYKLKKELLTEQLNNTFNEILKHLEKVFLEEDNYKITQAIQEVYTTIGSFISDYFRNQKSLKTHIYSIANVFRHIAENINNQNKLKDDLSDLHKLILDINKYAEIDNLSYFYNQISTFIQRNIDLTKNPNKNNKNINQQLKDQLKGLSVGIICRAQNIMATLLNAGKTYFIMYNEKYEECLKTKNI